MAHYYLKAVLIAGFFGGLIWGFCDVGHGRTWKHSRSHRAFERHVAELCVTAALGAAEDQHARPRGTSERLQSPDY